MNEDDANRSSVSPGGGSGSEEVALDHRLRVLDGLRAISILAVLAAHMLPLGPKSWRLNTTAALAGMSLFFVLSGFLIVRGLIKNPEVKPFLIRRLARIVPVAWLYLAIVFLLVTFDPRKFVGGLFFIENYEHSLLNGWNEHFWSLCVEVHFYAAMAITVAVLGRRGLWLVVPAAACVTLTRVLTGTGYAMETHLRVDEILSGACVALLLQRGHLKPLRMSWAIWAAIAFWLVCASPFSGPLQYLRPYAAAAVLVSALGLRPTMLKSLLTCSPARYVAEISYALYVFHPATYQGWMDEGSPWQKYLVKRPLSFAATFLLAHLSTRYWESWWIRLGKRAAGPVGDRNRR
jgi:peptidoglycan/LPS O-acetylase OafA/YrhL